MKLIGMMAMRNEDWVIGLSVRAALKWCDALVILLHECTDRTMEILREIEDEVGPDRMAYRLESGEWDEMRHRQTMLECARVWGATHLAIIDADEVLSGNLLAWGAVQVRDMIDLMPPGGHILQLPLYNLRHGIWQYHANGLWGNRWVSVAFADSPELHWSGDRFHSREPEPKQLRPWRPIRHGAGGIMHLWGTSERRLIAKHRAYKIAERIRFPHKPVADIEFQYNQATCGRPPYDTPKSWHFEKCPDSWWDLYFTPTYKICTDEEASSVAGKYFTGLNLDADPWQESWCDAQIAKHGREMFEGLSV